MGLTYDLVQDYHRLASSDISERLTDFADFVRNQAHILNIHPDLTFQQVQLCLRIQLSQLLLRKCGKWVITVTPGCGGLINPSHRAPRIGTYSRS